MTNVECKAVQSDPRRGIVYTADWVVDLCVQLVERLRKGGLSQCSFLDVGCGYGQFIGRFASRFVSEAAQSGQSLESTERLLLERWRGIEVRPETARLARERMLGGIESLTGFAINPSVAARVIINDDFLRWEPEPSRFDVIVGNIPYVRYDGIPSLGHVPDVAWLRERFSCFRGRADYSIPFLQRVVDLIAPAGVAAIVTSNRFTRSAYGRHIRAHFAASSHEIHEIDISQTSPFSTAVTAYASILLIAPKARGSRYVRLNAKDDAAVARLASGFPYSLRSCSGYQVVARGLLPSDGAPWTILSRTVTMELRRLARDFTTLGELGAGIWKGPATGADEVFVRKWEDFPFDEKVRREFLLPLFHWGSSGEEQKSRQQLFLLSLYAQNGAGLLPLEGLPEGIREYLDVNQERLKDRHVVRERGRDWWATIDRVYPQRLKLEKVIVPDLRPGSASRRDRGKLLPAHTAVAICHSDEALLDGLLEIIKSPVADCFRYSQAPAMGRLSPRASATNLRNLPIPDPAVLRSMAGCNGDSVYEAYEIPANLRQAFEVFGLSADRSD